MKKIMLVFFLTCLKYLTNNMRFLLNEIKKLL